jgi:PhzF family phenazine biosynthesis protein
VATPILQIDAFTDQPFSGNPAGVCILERPADERWMQNVAMEMNLAETAFVHRIEGGWSLRWFTPTVEVDLCGHATIAATHALLETGKLPENETARFNTKSGWLGAWRDGGWIEMDFPATPARPVDASGELNDALGAQPQATLRSKFDYLIEVASEEVVRAVNPDFSRLSKIETRGVIVTARSDDPVFDFVSRFFAPRVGIEEDPATGSSHCALAPYWAERLKKTGMVGRQLSKRGGVIRVKVKGDGVLIAGKAVTVLRGDLMETTDEHG